MSVSEPISRSGCLWSRGGKNIVGTGILDGQNNGMVGLVSGLWRTLYFPQAARKKIKSIHAALTNKHRQ